MINYSWIIPENAFQVLQNENGLFNVIKYIKWIRCAEDIDNDIIYQSEYSSIYGCPDPNADNYIIYENLTEEIVVSWLESGLNMERIDGALAKDIANQKLPKTEILPNPF